MLRQIFRDGFMIRILSAAICLISISGCGATLTPEESAYVDSLTPCEKIQGLVDSFDNGFAPLKATRVQNNFSDIWTPKYHLLGNSCQIIGFNANRMAYKCAEQYDDETQSRESFDWAVEKVTSCLGSQWQASETLQNDSKRITFKHTNHTAQISIQSGRTLAKYRKTWQTSFEVGDLMKN
jgi:hypothetical protein